MKTKGSILLSLIFIILVSSIGLSLLSYSITHFRIIKARKFRQEQIETLYNRLYLYLHNTRKKISEADISNIKDIEENFFNNENFPDKKINAIRIKNSFKFKSFNKEFYVKLRGIQRIDAYNTRNNYRFASGIRVIIYSGDIPVSLIPFLMTKKTTSTKQKNPGEYGVNVISPDDKMIISEKNLINDTERFLLENFTNSGTISITDLLKKEKTGSESLNENILFFSDISNRISMLINTSLDRLTFSINDEIQIIKIEKGNESYILKYIPKVDYIETSDTNNNPQGIFSEKILVNGDISLMEQNGVYAFSPETEIILTVFGNIVVNNSLKTMKRNNKSSPPLTLISIINPYLSRKKKGGIITLTGGGLSRYDLSIISSKEIINLNRVAELYGTLTSPSINNSGKLNIHSEYFSDNIDWIRLPGFTLLSKIYIDYIEEIFNDK